jgi:hydroxymethylpyrimidine pyrophosphatase-like HAD family hydrolase
MLNHVAHGIAMGNGEEQLKQIAEYVCDDVDHDGIVKALRHYELIK